jgi:hypothetical protein
MKTRLLLLCLLNAAIGAAQPSDPLPCGIVGIVTDAVTEDYLPQMRVQVTTLAASTLTDASGYYRLPLPPGTYNVVASGACFETDTAFAITVAPDSVRRVHFALNAPAISCSHSSLNLEVRNHAIDTTSIIIYNSGAGALNFQAIPVCHPADKWLMLSPYSGIIPAHDSLRMIVRVDADTLDDRLYDLFGVIHLYSNSCPDSLLSIVVNAAVLDVEAASPALPDYFAITAAPDPFNPVTTLFLTTPRATPATLIIYDALGRRMQTLYEGSLTAGQHRFQIDGSRWSSGVYFARFQSAATSQTCKLHLLR